MKPTCPIGGVYTYNPMARPPTCNISGHVLFESQKENSLVPAPSSTPDSVKQDDPREQMRLLKIRADNGDSDAQLQLARFYDTGDGAEKDKIKAVGWYRKAAEQGNVKAQLALGTMYGLGKGVIIDTKEAAKWLGCAARQGEASAQAMLGTLYYAGRGIEVDEMEALKWFRASAEQGNALGQMSLGRTLEGKKDYIEAYKWYNLAAASGFSGASDKRAALEQRMSRSQVQEAQKRSREFIPKRQNSAP